MVARREFLVGAAAFMGAAAVVKAAPSRARSQAFSLEEPIRALEHRSGGRLGIALLDTGSGSRFAWRADERFPLCSTFKFLLAADLLHRVDAGQERLDRRLPIRAVSLGNSDFTKSRVGRDASIRELCQAIIEISDNEAANLLLRQIGGPAGLTRFTRTIGDSVTRLDRFETMMSDATPGDRRDTSSPNAMVANFERILLGGVLRPASRATLTDWLVGVRTGETRLKAGLPLAWRIGHKTGTGSHGTANDVAIVWPGRRPPFILATYLTRSTLGDEGRNAVLADVARAVAAAVSPAA
ncbi:MAG TPA: class A beta-lactamase [Allosphingosinicella sp.]|jgi:beta-lactamase class A|nr:class A beta-lactamase [Allosphingosinicella sp.]